MSLHDLTNLCDALALPDIADKVSQCLLSRVTFPISRVLLLSRQMRCVVMRSI